MCQLCHTKSQWGALQPPCNCRKVKFDERDYAEVFQCSKWWDHSSITWVWSEFASIPPQGLHQTGGQGMGWAAARGVLGPGYPAAIPVLLLCRMNPAPSQTPAAGSEWSPLSRTRGHSQWAINTSLNDIIITAFSTGQGEAKLCPRV